MVWALLVACLLPLAGCFGGGLPLPSARPGELLTPDLRRLDDLSEALAEAGSDAARTQIAADALAVSGVAPLADARVLGKGGRFVVGVDGQTLAGWIPGRVPLHKDSLIVVAASRDGVSDLALIEASRMLVASGAYTQIPARSVLVVLGDDVRAPLRLWNREAVLSVLRVGTAGPDSLAGRPVQALAPEANAATLAARLYEALSLAATPSPSVYTR